MRHKSRLPGPQPNATPASPSACERLVRDIRRVTQKHYSAGGLWVQSALVDEGLARVVPLPGELDCVRELYAREAVARAKRVGLWANPAYSIRQARHTRTLERLLGTFQIVEGWVAEVGATRSEVFLNFGRNWRWDFNAAVDLRRAPDKDAIAARLSG